MTKIRARMCLIIFALCVTSVLGGVHPDGVSHVSRAQDAAGNYKFSYSVNNGDGDHFRQEETDHLGRVVGAYGLTHADGTQRVVDYIADKDGFRAQVRSNEPGLASSESDALTVVKTGHHDPPLAVAATSLGGYGTRLKSENSRVTYVQPEAVVEQEKIENLPHESRQRNFDDYRPRSPVAYYPGEEPAAPRSVNPPAYDTRDTFVRQNNNPELSTEDVRPLEVYLPPINPHAAVRRPGYYPSNDRGGSFYPSTTSRRPFIPPYGGFDDDPLPVEKQPGVSLPTVHGGVSNDHFLPTPPTALYGAGRYPSAEEPVPREFGSPRFPHRPDFPPFNKPPGSLLPPPPQRGHPGVAFNPPAYEDGISPQNFVLRAVPIPNGIQAVKVDPNTGRVYERVVYPIFLREDGRPDYDRNILLHNDDVTDDGALRNDDHGHYDIPFRRRPSYRGARNNPVEDNEDVDEQHGRFNRSNFIDLKSLGIPTARDLAWVHQQLSMVEGFDRHNRFENGNFLGNFPLERPDFHEFDNLDEPSVIPGRPYPRPGFPSSGSLDHSGGDTYSRSLRHAESLTPSDSKEVKTSNLETSSTNQSKNEAQPSTNSKE